MKLAVLHPGSRMGYAIPVMLIQAGMVSNVYTDFFLSQNNSILKLSKGGAFPTKLSERYLHSRSSNSLDSSYVKSLNLEGLKLFWQRRKTKKLIERLNLEYLMVEKLSRKMLLDEDEFDSVYSFISASNELFSLFPSKIKILDAMHPPHQFLIPHLKREFLKFEEWQEYKNPYEDGAEEVLIERENKELKKADLILAPSQFVIDTLESIMPKHSLNISLSPYPIPLWVDTYGRNSAWREKRFSRDKLRILFVGNVNLRKGIQYLLPALKKLKKLNIELHVLGKVNINPKKVIEYEDICEFKGFVSKTELSEEYQWADLFVFPSIAEGSAGVIYEAMSFGLPIITTYATGSVVRNNVDGFVMQKPSVEELMIKISTLYFDRELLKEMSDNVIERISFFSAEKLSPNLASLLGKII